MRACFGNYVELAANTRVAAIVTVSPILTRPGSTTCP
jgi:hypothetical protein